MTPHIVVDIGNTRIKWGRCSNGAVTESASLPHADPGAWQQQLDLWNLQGPSRWVVTGVNPSVGQQLADWIRQRGDMVVMLEKARFLPLQVPLEHPDWVGIDRLLNAVAANGRRRQAVPAVIVDAGSAVTVDYVDEAGSFRGGAIFPGPRLMVQALHDHTALLPLVEVQPPIPPLPGSSTTKAMQAGVYWSVTGGIQALVGRMAALGTTRPEVFLTGGYAPVLAPALEGATVWPNMTLEGVRLAAEALP